MEIKAAAPRRSTEQWRSNTSERRQFNSSWKTELFQRRHLEAYSAPVLTANHHYHKRGTDSCTSASRQHNPELREIGGKHLTVMPKSRRLGILWENQEESMQVTPAELEIVGWLSAEKQNLAKVTKPARRNQYERKNADFFCVCHCCYHNIPCHVYGNIVISWGNHFSLQIF